jgi:hypothetical protein
MTPDELGISETVEELHRLRAINAELLAALQWIVSEADRLNSQAPVWDEARAVIRKATKP